MRLFANGAVLGLAIAGAVAALPPPATAAHVSISVDPNAIAFGFSDGYWDRDHHWHRWASPADARWYRMHYRSHYYGHRHDRDHDGGWRHEWWR